MQVYSAFDKTAPESFLKGVISTCNWLSTLPDPPSALVLALLLGLDSDAGGSVQLSASLPSTSVEPAMDCGASSPGSTDRFSARTDATSTLAGLQSIRGEDVNAQANCHRALANVPHRCCMAVRVDALCVPHFLEARTFPYVNFAASLACLSAVPCL